MASVEEQIRELVNEARTNAQRRGIDADEERDERLAQLADDAEQMADALLTILEEHGPNIDDPDKCACLEYDDVYVANNRPDRTVRAIAKALGIEVDGD